MSDSDSDRSSDYEPESIRDLKAADVVLSQMRRGAQKRGGQSKLKARYEVRYRFCLVEITLTLSFFRGFNPMAK